MHASSSRGAAGVDLLIVAAAFAAFVFLIHALDLPAAGTVAVVVALAAATWRLRAAGESWATLGLRAPDSWARVALWVVGLYAAILVTNFLVVMPLGRALGWPPVDLSRFATLKGNALQLAGWLALSWTTAAFAEELVFRGFVLTRLQTVLGRGALPAATAVLVQAAIFGSAHGYLGVRGAVVAGMVGLVFGAAYVVNGRSLVPLVIAHGLTDSVSFVTIYLGAAHPR